ncbi:plasmid mobilization protein [Luteimonas aestuarii]|uniref:Plasmid mobilization protein n=1 Tax=Luteimonas aestuarii TaxID=453837 RepID=A0A4R5TYB4_9GAMM|nr:MobA/MobL family protein [Luteimonas aestuarii]TDK26219.1 plasmid mobilization protein [Luteimonas aestuarii]
MAIYHTRVKTFGRAQGHASTAAAAYRAGLLIVDTRTGAKHDYRRRGGVVETRCVVPDHAPDWSLDPTLLWPAAENAERRKDATVAREFEIALPHELDDAQRSELTAQIARSLVERYGFAVMASIHEPQTADGLNYHAHLLATTRRIGPDGLAAKTRELDGGPSGRGEVEWIRSMVATVINEKLAAAGIDCRVDHRSLKEQGQAALDNGDLAGAIALSRQPTQHMGKNATALHRRGAECERTQANLRIRSENEQGFEAALRELGVPATLATQEDAFSGAQWSEDENDEPRTGFRLPEALTAGDPNSHIRFYPTHTPALGTAAGRSDHMPADATRQVLSDATSLWGEGFFKTISLSFKATSTLLRHQADRLANYLHSALFRADARNFLDLIRQVKRDALRFQRRLRAEERASHALAQAELSLERFDSEYPQPGQLSRQEWSRRRARRLRAVQVCQDTFRRAREATGPAAQESYDRKALASGEALESWSSRMLERYPVDADREEKRHPDAPMTAPASQGAASLQTSKSRPRPCAG